MDSHSAYLCSNQMTVVCIRYHKHNDKLISRLQIRSAIDSSIVTYLMVLKARLLKQAIRIFF
jgi:hypothetical protein